MATATKPWYASKTIWSNVILAGLAIISEVSKVFPVSQHPEIWTSAAAVLNIILRLITTTPISGGSSSGS